MKKVSTILLVLVLLSAAVAVQAGGGTVTVASRPDITVYEPLDHYAALDSPDWGEPGSAVATWVHPSWPSIPDAVWVSSDEYVEDPSTDSWRLFHDEMVLPCTAYNVDASVDVAATSDNAEEFYFNGALVGSDGEVEGAFEDNYEWNTILNYPVSPQAGTNSLDFIVRNYSGSDSPTANPTGLLYKVTVNYEIPDVVWQPPVTNDAFELKDGTTLPLKFKLYEQGEDGALITDQQDVYLVVYAGECDTELGEPIVTWALGSGVESLRFDPYEYYYIANFQTKSYELVSGATYSAVVYDACTDEVLGCIDFVVNTATGTGRGNK